MKLAIVFLSCLVAITLQQQDVYWPSPLARYPFYYGGNDYEVEFNPTYQRSGYMPYFSKNSISENRLNVADDSSPSPRFGYTALNSLLSLLKATSTSYTTSVSTVSANTVVTCYTKTMFSATTACRRKRNIKDMISVGDEAFVESPQHETLDSGIDRLPREGRDMNAVDLIKSSKQESVADLPELNNLGRKERQMVARLIRNVQTTTVTSTITSYSLSYSTSTATNTKLAATTALSCLPSGFTLC